MCMRAIVGAAYCRHYAQTQIRLTSRRGASLMCGEDTEICYIACEMGFGMGLFPELCVKHLIPRVQSHGGIPDQANRRYRYFASPPALQVAGSYSPLAVSYN